MISHKSHQKVEFVELMIRSPKFVESSLIFEHELKYFLIVVKSLTYFYQMFPEQGKMKQVIFYDRHKHHPAHEPSRLKGLRCNLP